MKKNEAVPSYTHAKTTKRHKDLNDLEKILYSRGIIIQHFTTLLAMSKKRD